MICARYINNTVKSWINGSADINAGWDEYVNQINKLGMEDYVACIRRPMTRFTANNERMTQ